MSNRTPHGRSAPRRRVRGEEGYVLVLTALLLLPLLAVTGLAVDLGAWYARAAAIQRAADAAALAGVVYLPDLGAATTRAESVAAANGFADDGRITVDVTQISGSDHTRYHANRTGARSVNAIRIQAHPASSSRVGRPAVAARATA